jgi:GT2 family glycosyltransferase
VTHPGGPPEVSVVIPARNAVETIGDQLAALGRQTFPGPWELVVVDNGSTDGTGDLASSAAGAALPCVRVVTANERSGVSYARNVGVRAAAAPLIAICDADDVVEPGWLEAIVSGLGEADLVGGRVDVDRLNGPQDRGADEGRPPRDGITKVPGFFPYVVGCNLGMRREAWDTVGGFDEHLVGGGDDVDFSWRAQLAGLRLGFAPDAVVAVRYRRGLGALARQHFSYTLAWVALYRRYRSHGLEPRHPGRAALGWARLALRSWWVLRSRHHRAHWVKEAAVAAGHIVGSIRYRVICL